MTSADVLVTSDIAKLAGITPASFRRYVARGDAPPADGHVGRTPFWHRLTIEEWIAQRPGRGRKPGG